MKVERAVNVVAIGLLVAVIVSAGARYHSSSRATQTTHENLTQSLAIDFGRAPHTLIIVMQQDCEYCAASLPFYQKVLAERSRRGMGLQVAVVVPQRDKDIASYLASHGIEADAIAHVRGGSLGVRMTPTLLLAGRSGELLNTWPGYLPPPVERAVLKHLFGD